MNYDEQEQPLQPIKKIDDEVLDRFINTYGFKHEVQETKKGEKQLNIASASIGDNIYIIRKNGSKGSNYSFLSVSKENFDNFRGRQNEGFTTFKFIDFNTDYFKKNEQKFIKSLKENKMFDDIKVKDGDYEDFRKKTIQALTNHPSDRIKTIDPKEIKDIQPEPIPEKKELMGDDDEEEEERMNDDDEEEEEEEEKQRKEIEERKRKMKEEEEEDYEEEEKPIKEEEEDKIPSDDEKLNSQIVQYEQDFNLKTERKGNRGKMPKKYSDFFKEIKGKYGFTIPNDKGNTGQAYLRVGDDIIFVRKLTDKTKGTSKYRYKVNDRNKDNNLMIAIMNKSDFPKLDSDNEDVKARFFNFSLDYYKKNKDKFNDAIENKEFIFDQDLQKINDEYNFNDYFLNKENLENYNIIPKDFDYRKVFSNNNQNNELINTWHTPEGEELRALIKYNNNSDSLLKLIVSLSENNKGEVDFKEIGEIQDLNGDITDLYSDMQDLKSKINSSNNAEAKERLLIKYNQKRLKLEDRIKKYSKEAYRLSTLKKKKATMATHKYLMNKLNKLKT